jgi:hypothetical protein
MLSLSQGSTEQVLGTTLRTLTPRQDRRLIEAKNGGTCVEEKAAALLKG